MTTIREHAQEYDGRFVGNDRFPMKVGDVGFLLEMTTYNGQRKSQRIELRQHPAAEAVTFDPILYGFIPGSRTDVEALGLAEVVEATPNGRGKIKTLWEIPAEEALEKLGYPDISDQLNDAEDKWTPG